jgi:hypothetical protein
MPVEREQVTLTGKLSWSVFPGSSSRRVRVPVVRGALDGQTKFEASEGSYRNAAKFARSQSGQHRERIGDVAEPIQIFCQL